MALTSLTFIGFPYILIDAGEPKYFSTPQRPRDGVGRWQNLYLSDDVLGSKISDYLSAMFKAPNDTMGCILLEEMTVAAQHNIPSWSNPITRHMAYWDPKVDEPCEAVKKVARLMLQPSTSGSNLTLGTRGWRRR